MNILHISEQLEAAKADNNPGRATTIILSYLDAHLDDEAFSRLPKAEVLALTKNYFTHPQTVLKQLEALAK